MKILGISGGRKMGNSEILLKEALMGAKEEGADVEFIRMLDMDIRPCKLGLDCEPSILRFQYPIANHYHVHYGTKVYLAVEEELESL